MSKKAIRKRFREDVFARDKYRCAACGKPGRDRQGGSKHLKFHKNKGEEQCFLDAHHIVSRDIAKDGGYVLENGITLCPGCHIKAEENEDGYKVEDLKAMI